MTHGPLPGNPSRGLLSHRENFSLQPLWPVPANVMKPAFGGSQEKYTALILGSYRHEGAAAPPPQRWFCGGPEAGSRPWQSRCRSGSRDGSGPASRKKCGHWKAKCVILLLYFLFLSGAMITHICRLTWTSSSTKSYWIFSLDLANIWFWNVHVFSTPPHINATLGFLKHKWNCLK